jgi:adenylate cyclase
MSPHALIKLLNDYFSPMTQIIMANRGTLDKYIGDAIMALWGAPVPLPDHALRACQAALEMEKAMTELQNDWQMQGLPPLVARLGLHSGSVVAGNVGSRERFNYTVLGDTVNLASRLEGVNKVYGTRILLSDKTCQHVKDRLLVRELDLVQVKGRGRPVTVYELLGAYPPEGNYPWLEYFAAGLQAYRQQQWEEASQAFNEVLRLKPHDRPTQVFLGRCRFFAVAPPPSDWQGVFVLDAK